MPLHPRASARAGFEPRPGCSPSPVLRQRADERLRARRFVLSLGRRLDAEAERHDLRDLDLGEGLGPLELLHGGLDVALCQRDEPLEMHDGAVGLGETLLGVDVGRLGENRIDLVVVLENDAHLGQRLERVGLGDGRLVEPADQRLELALGLGERVLGLAHPGQRDGLALQGGPLPAELELGDRPEDCQAVHETALLQVPAGDGQEGGADSLFLRGIHVDNSLQAV